MLPGGWVETAAAFSIIRDVLLILIFVVILAALLFGYVKIRSILKSIDETLKSTREAAEAVSARLSEPTTSQTGFMFGIGKMLAFIFGRLKGSKK